MIFRIKDIDEENFIIRGIFSTGEEDRQGEIIDQNGWKLDDFMENPVVLFAHDHYQPAVGKVIEITKKDGQLEGAIQFAAKEYDFAATLYKLYAGGFMRAFSVGFMNDRYEIDQENNRTILKENVLYEVSCVNVPANAMALAFSKGIDVSPVQRFMKEMRMRSVVPYADHGMAEEDAEWDGPAQTQACGDDFDKLKSICAWFNSDEPEAKSSYKLPHHRADDMKAVWKGVAAAMGALLGGRGGTDIPESERQGVYSHLAKHYKQFDKEAPEFKSYNEEELKAIENGEEIKEEKRKSPACRMNDESVEECVKRKIPELIDEGMDQDQAVAAANGICKTSCEDKGIKPEKAVEILSGANIQTIQSAIKTLTDVLDAHEKRAKGSTPRGNARVSVTVLNAAIRQLLKARKTISGK